jgi:hypothetical protein
MILRFLVYFFLVFQVREAFSASTPILLMVKDGAYFEPFLYRISSKGKGSLFFLGVDHLDYPLKSFHPMVYRLITSSDALLFEILTQELINSLTQYSKEYLELEVNVTEEIERLRAEIAQGQKSFYSFADRIKLILQEKGYETSLFGLDDPATLFKINKLQKTALTDLPRSESEIVKIQKLFMLGDSQGL